MKKITSEKAFTRLKQQSINAAVLLGFTISALSGCGSNPAVSQDSHSVAKAEHAVKNERDQHQNTKSVIDGIALNNKKISGVTRFSHSQMDTLAVATEQAGLTLVSVDRAQGGTAMQSLSGEFELIDSRATQNRQWLMTAQAQTGQPLLFSAETQSTLLENPVALRDAAFQVDALCLYLDNQENLFAFMLDGYGGGEMRWLWDGRRDAAVDITIKPLSLPPGSESCVVDDATASLLVVEEEFGVWRYPAEAENAWQRRLLAAKAPWGKLDFGPLTITAVAPNYVAVLGENRAEVLQLADKEGVTQSVYRAKPKVAELASAAVFNGQWVWVDEGADALVVEPFNTAKLKPNAQELTRKAVPAVYPTVMAMAQTPAMGRRGDAADDPAIWLHPTHPEKSLVLGTNKKWGLFVYDLNGQTQQSIATGHINNVDVRQGLALTGPKGNTHQPPIDIAIASNRSDNTLTIYTLNPLSGHVTQAANVPTELNDVYGVCLYAPESQKNSAGLGTVLYAFINDKDGRFQQYQVFQTQSGVTAKRVREFALHSQPEACVVNDTSGDLFIGEEDAGVWLFSAEPSSTTSGQLIAATGDVLVADVEGLALVDNDLGHYLVVSSQGDNSYALYQAEAPYEYVGSFRVGLNSEKRIDGASETDGLAVNGSAFSAEYPQGLLVVQDGFNLMPSQPQNFKYVSWKDVIEALKQR